MTWIILSLASGTCGRMGGAHGYSTYFRDIGCSIIAVIATVILAGLHPVLWWAYLLIFGFHWACFSTYWQFLFKGEDNLAFSGFMVGLAWMPVLVINVALWPVVAIRIVVLCVVWGLLNKKLPNMPGRDVVEEFSRYAVAL